MSTTTDLATLKINYLTQQQYEDALEDGLIEDNELYFTDYASLVSVAIQADYDSTTQDLSLSLYTRCGTELPPIADNTLYSAEE